MFQNGTVHSSNGTTDQSASSDRRSLRRNRVLKGARLVFNSGLGVAEAAVYDLTENGARLRFGQTTGIPQKFTVEIRGRDGRRNARIVWRNEREIGLRFG